MWDDHWQEYCVWTIVFEFGWGRNNKSAEEKYGVAKEETKFKTKMIRGKKIKWGKRREEQNTRIEISYKSVVS